MLLAPKGEDSGNSWINWVLGEIADRKIPLGPYTPTQRSIAVTGGYLLGHD